MTTDTIHTCSYSCERPGCIRAQRDELAARLTAAQPAISGYTCTVPDDCETLHWRGQILSMNELASVAQPAEGEEIMVNTPYDVFTLPLRPSGLSSGPRFVVHVPGPDQQPAAVDEAMLERIAALLHEEATGEPWIVAGVEHPGPDRDYYRGLARKVLALASALPSAHSDDLPTLLDNLMRAAFDDGDRGREKFSGATMAAREAVLAHVRVQQPAAAQPQPKRRPYNASGSLSEYGVFPECDAQQPADDEVVFIDGVGAWRSSVKSCRDGVQWIRVGDRVYWPLSDSDAKRLQSACCGNGSFDGPATPAVEGERQ